MIYRRDVVRTLGVVTAICQVSRFERVQSPSKMCERFSVLCNDEEPHYGRSDVVDQSDVRCNGFSIAILPPRKVLKAQGILGDLMLLSFEHLNIASRQSCKVTEEVRVEPNRVTGQRLSLFVQGICSSPFPSCPSLYRCRCHQFFVEQLYQARVQSRREPAQGQQEVVPAQVSVFGLFPYEASSRWKYKYFTAYCGGAA